MMFYDTTVVQSGRVISPPRTVRRSVMGAVAGAVGVGTREFTKIKQLHRKSSASGYMSINLDP